jgi:hypothetical protein
MRSKLDYIESRLQSLVENRFTWLPWRNQQPRLARQITSAFRARLFDPAGDDQLLPNIIEFKMHPENVSAWKSHPDWMNWLNQALLDTVQESGSKFAAPPVIHLLEDPSLGLGELEIQAEYERSGSGSTAALHLSDDGDGASLVQAPVNAFLIVNGSEYIPLAQSVTNLGRMNSNHIVLEDLRVSRSHAQIRSVRGRWVLFDLNSTGGTFVNGLRISQYTLSPGDVISLAGVQVIYAEENPLGDTGGETTPT